jgi:hypothetical protein
MTSALALDETDHTDHTAVQQTPITLLCNRHAPRHSTDRPTASARTCHGLELHWRHLREELLISGLLQHGFVRVPPRPLEVQPVDVAPYLGSLGDFILTSPENLQYKSAARRVQERAKSAHSRS